mgnify:CR=1 FL=1
MPLPRRKKKKKTPLWLPFAVVMAVIAVGALLPWTRPMFLNDRYATLSGAVLAQLMMCEIIYGLLAGLLFWRYGLEVAILAHMVAYLLSHGLV